MLGLLGFLGVQYGDVAVEQIKGVELPMAAEIRLCKMQSGVLDCTQKVEYDEIVSECVCLHPNEDEGKNCTSEKDCIGYCELTAKTLDYRNQWIHVHGDKTFKDCTYCHPTCSRYSYHKPICQNGVNGNYIYENGYNQRKNKC